MEKKPVIDTCRSSLEFSGGEIVQSPTRGSTSCSAQQDVYINKNPKKALFGFGGSFLVNVPSPEPDFIKSESWNYGLFSGRFLVVHKQFNGKPIIFKKNRNRVQSYKIYHGFGETSHMGNIIFVIHNFIHLALPLFCCIFVLRNTPILFEMDCKQCQEATYTSLWY